MPLSTADLDYVLSQWAANKALYASLHSAWSASGASELSGGSPAYARLAVTWGTPSGGSMALAGAPYAFNVPASSTVAWVGFWDAVSGGNFAGMFPGGDAPAYAFAAPSATSVLLAPGTAYTADEQVTVFATGGSSLPSGLVAGTVYYVKSPSGDSFSLSATSGGAAITLTSDGSGIVQAVTAETYGSQGTYDLSGCTVTAA